MIIAIDPGQSTGIAIKTDNDYIVENQYVTKVLKHELNQHTAEQVWNLLIDVFEDSQSGSKTNDVVTWYGIEVVIERFATSGVLSKYGAETIEIVGGVKALCQLYEIPIFVHQPQTRYPFQQQAKEMLSTKKHVIHEEDALAHLLAFEYIMSHKDSNKSIRKILLGE